MHITDGEMGLAMGAGAAIRNLEGKAARAINERNNDLKEAYDEIRKLQVALLTEQAHNAGLTAQIEVLQNKIENTDEIFIETGRKYPSGKAEKKIHAFYNAAFDKFVASLPEKFRIKIIRAQAK